MIFSFFLKYDNVVVTTVNKSSKNKNAKLYLTKIRKKKIILLKKKKKKKYGRNRRSCYNKQSKFFYLK